MTAAETHFLRAVARKTWAFFERFVGPKDHWLPPDNVQEHPAAAIAHRTSPTNMGLSLLANLAAYDFGYLSTGRLVERTANAIHTMASLERYRGHFYNWYDTQSLQPLRPHYVSSVDSGNLAGHLLTLRQGLLGLPDKKIVGPNLFAGLADTLQMVVDATEDAVSAELARVESAVISAADDPPRTLTAVRHRLESITKAAESLVNRLVAGPDSQAKVWAQALAQQCQDALADLAFIAPWTSLPEAPSSLDGFAGLDQIPTLRELAGIASRLLPAIEARLWPGAGDAQWWAELQRLVAECSQRAQKRIAVLQQLALRAGELARMEYDFLFDETRHLLAIGYNVDDRRRDSSYYDLLASEARLSTFVAIAQGQIPQESWFALGRRLTSAGGKPILLSWSGSMFEYLMPLLVMPTYPGTLLDQTCRTAVERQIEYGAQRGVPWGMSESGYNTVDAHLNYQYRAFGVPGLGLKRGLAEDLVVAPYASALALMVAPKQACENLRRLAAEGCAGNFGFYEAIDYTPSRLPRGQSSAVVRSFMAHHQGMSLLALAHVLLDRPMQARFESDPAFQATTLLLQERIPKAVAPYVHTAELAQSQTAASGPATPVRVFDTPHTAAPEVQLLSNGRYHVMITNAGGGYSRWNDIAVTRWREDSTRDHWGTFCYLRDAASGKFWSTAYQPALKRSDSYQAIYSESRAEFRCRKHELDAHTEIAVSPEDDIELRRITISNRGRKRQDHRSDQLRRSGPGLARRGCATSGTGQPVRADRDSARPTGHPGYPPAAFSERAGGLDVPSDGRARGRRGRDLVRDRPLPFHRTRPHRRGSASHAERREALGQPGLGARSHRRDPAADHARSGHVRDYQHRLRGGPDARRLFGIGRQIPGPAVWRTGSSIWPGRTARWRCNRSTPAKPMRNCMGVWPGPSSTPTPRCAPSRAWSRRTAAGSPACGAIPFPAICPSCCSRSGIRRISNWSASWCRPTRTGAGAD